MVPWVLEAAGALGELDPVARRARTVAAVAVAVAERLGVELPDLALLGEWGRPAAVALPPGEVDVELLGTAYEALQEQTVRRSAGVVYTPAAVASELTALAFDSVVGGVETVCDPAVGAGAFLLAAARCLEARGGDRASIVAHALVGVDVDPLAVAVAEATLCLWAGGGARPRLVVADALTLDPWPAVPDLVVGNPPFLGQMRRSTRRHHDARAVARRHLGVASGYVDTAALFLLLASRRVRPGGVAALVVPTSVLTARDAGAVRSAVAEDAELVRLWAPARRPFGAEVDVCAPVVRRTGSSSDVLSLRSSPWSAALADLGGVPRIELATGAVLGDECAVTADFRDQYYGVAPFVVDDPGQNLDDRSHPRLVTSGLVDPAVCRWGSRPVRYQRRLWDAPRVDLAGVAGDAWLARWAAARLVPKVVVATQTRLVEAAVDEAGTWLPSTPLVSVVPPRDRLWHAAAVLLSPPVSAWTARRVAGAGLHAGALKLGVATVRAMPLPGDRDAWDEAAAAVRDASHAADDGSRRTSMLDAGRASCRAYGVDDPAVFDWWAALLK